MKALAKVFPLLNMVLFVGFVVMWFRGIHEPTVGLWTYNDMISTLLTVVTVVLASVAVFVGLAAVWGYQSITKQAELKAVEAASEAGKIYLESDAFIEKVRAIASAEVMENLPAILETRSAIDPVVVPEEAPRAAEPVEVPGDQAWEDDL